MGNPNTSQSWLEMYFKMKSKFPDILFVFRVGNYYEMYCDDALVAYEILGFAVSISRIKKDETQCVEIVRFVYQALDLYLAQLVRSGRRVAICEQKEDPKTRKLVKRGITELITPGSCH